MLTNCLFDLAVLVTCRYLDLQPSRFLFLIDAAFQMTRLHTILYRRKALLGPILRTVADYRDTAEFS